MRRLMALSICFLSVMPLSSCRSTAGHKNSVEVIINGDGQFPEFLVGKWEADTGGWEINFEPDGTISSAVISLGRVRMIPGQITKTKMRLGGEGIFEPGQWTVQYLQTKRELMVEIAIKHFTVVLGENELHGKTREILIGQVSSDGQLWWPERFTYPEYIADTKKYPDYKLPVDHNDNPRGSLTFHKAIELK
jgi:hypothetical protein